MRRFVLITLFSFSFCCFGFEMIPTQRLLLDYLENDLELQNLTLAAKNAELSVEYAKVSNGFDVTLNSGTVVLALNEDGTELTATPSLEMSLPQASGLSITAQTDLSMAGESTELSDSSISAELDLISTSTLSRSTAVL